MIGLTRENVILIRRVRANHLRRLKRRQDRMGFVAEPTEPEGVRRGELGRVLNLSSRRIREKQSI